MSWSAQKNTNFGSQEFIFYAIPGTDIVFVFYTDASNGSTPNLKVQKSLDSGNTFAAAVTITPTITGGDMGLNEPIAFDPTAGANGAFNGTTGGRLFCVYGKNIDQGGSVASLAVKYSDDLGATWSTETILDDGTTNHAGKLNSFYRSGVYAYNGSISVTYTYESNSTFTTDGLWRTTGTYSNAAVTWVATSKVYGATLVAPTEPNVAGFSDGTVICSFYDPGVVANQSGDIWITRSLDYGQTWDASPTKLTTTTDYGRPRIVGENGTWWIVANKPWDKETSSIYADVYTLKSTDNGVTWGAPTMQISHGAVASSLDHPDIAIQADFVGIICRGTSTGGTGHSFISSTDGGSTWSSVSNPLADSTVSDAPRLIVTNSYLIATGYDSVNTRTMWAVNPQWFAVLPTSQTSVLDNFNRVSENPLSNGGKWTAGGWASAGETGLKTDGTEAVRQAGAGTFGRNGSYWNSLTITANTSCEVFGTIVSTQDGELDLGIFNPTTRQGYYLSQGYPTFDDPTNPVFEVLRTNAGTNTVLGQLNPYSVAAGEKVCLQIVGGEIVLWHFTGGAWTEKFRIVDTTYRQAWNIGSELAGLNQIGPPLDDFGGGVLSVPANSVAPVASGTVGTGLVISSTRGTWTNTPVRFTYQWQTSPDNSVWTSVAKAVLPFFAVTDQTKYHRCLVTSYNEIGAGTATASNVLSPASGPSGGTIGESSVPFFVLLS